MIITVADVVSTETTCVGIVIDCRDSPDSPYPNGGNLLTVYVSIDGKTQAAGCVNTRYENYEILCRLYPDLQIEILKSSHYDGYYMRVSDPRVGPEWLIPTEN